MKTIAQIIHHKSFTLRIHDDAGNLIFYEYSNGDWYRCQYDPNGTEIYYDNSAGYVVDNRT